MICLTHPTSAADPAFAILPSICSVAGGDTEVLWKQRVPFGTWRLSLPSSYSAYFPVFLTLKTTKKIIKKEE